MTSTRNAGLWALAVLTLAVGCEGAAVGQGGGGGGGGGAGQSVAVRISPTQAQVGSGGVADFTATVTGTANTSVAWSVTESGGGTVNASGGYTAPSSTGTFHVVATSAADSTKSATAVVTVVPAGSVYTLPADRMTDWTHAGVTYGGGGIPTNRTQCGATLTPSGGNDLSQINAAISACTAGHYVLLGPGTFTISGSGQSINISKSNITIRGSGAGVTTVTRSDGAVDGSYVPNAAAPIFYVGGGGTPSTSYNLASDGADGSFSVVLTSAPAGGFTAGQIVHVDELSGASFQTDPNGRGQVLMSDDGKITYMCHNPTITGDNCGEYSLYQRQDRPTQDIKEVASWDAGTMTLTFTSPLHTAYRTSHTAQVAVYASGAFLTGIGVENLTISRGDKSNITFQDVTYSWVKSVEVTKWLNEGVRWIRCFRCELRESYVHTPVYFEPGGASYNISMEWGSSELLIENSISRDADKVLVSRTAGAGSVVAYNYMDDGHIGSSPTWQEMGLGASHFVGPHHVLFEGNWAYNGDNDKTHGNSNTHTYFRNLLRGTRSSYNDNGQGIARCAGVTDSTYYMSFVGNVLGASGQMSGFVYESGSSPSQGPGIWKMGWDDWSPYPHDPLSTSTTIRDGNYDYLTNQVHWHGLGGSGQGNGLTPPAASTLPNSLYLSSTPPFFNAGSGYTWPWIDPTGATKVYTLPAKARYDAGTPFVQP